MNYDAKATPIRPSPVWAVAGVLALGVLAQMGCQPTGYLLYLFTPAAQAKTVEAEFHGLEGRRVAVVIYADPRVQYDYPFARLTVATAVGSELRNRLKGVTVIEPAKIIKYQDQNTYWESMEKTELAKALGADYVLMISLMEYTTRELGSVDLLRGRITAQCSVCQAGLAERESCVWRGKDIVIVYPPDRPAGAAGDNDTAIRVSTERLFAEELTRKFYKHKVQPEGQ